MLFAWDTHNISHIRRHRIEPHEAEQVIENDPLDLGVQFQNGEERITHLGETNTGRVLFVVVTIRSERLRVVTAYPANRKSRAFYSIQRDVIHEKDFRDP